MDASLTPVDIVEDSGDEEPGVVVGLTVRGSEMSGAVEVGTVEVDGVEHACVVVVYPSAAVAALNVSSLGSGVRTALLSVIG